MANLLAARSDLPAALLEAQKAVALGPDQAQCYLKFALLQLRAAQPDAAEANFKKAIELDGKQTNARVALGTLYASRHRMPEAEEQFRLAMQERSD